MVPTTTSRETVCLNGSVNQPSTQPEGEIVLGAADVGGLICRLCGQTASRIFVDLGPQPPCEDFLRAEELTGMEPTFPLDVRVCDACLLVQLPAHLAADEVFTPDYAYHSSFSTSWVEHARLGTPRG